MNPSTSTTGRYLFLTTTANQASIFAVDSVTGNLYDTSTGYDIYLTNSNSEIAVVQAYDAVTAASTANIAGFKCAPEAGDNKLVCDNINHLDALYNCGAYLYATPMSYNFAQCGINREVTFVGIAP